MRLDEAKLEALRRWGQALQGADSEEQAAAGRAILMLIEEIERLRLELLDAREQWSRMTPTSGDAAEDTGGPLGSTLHRRLQRALRRDSDSSPGSPPEPVDEAGSGPEVERATAERQAWIESLRRQS
jgi:hypothetical protein